MSAHITKQLGMAPGGEFRAAFQAVSIDCFYSCVAAMIDWFACREARFLGALLLFLVMF